MNFIKLFVGPAFRKYEFVSVLHELNVSAKVVEDGIILDRDNFNANCNMHQWTAIMAADVNNPLKTREAEPSEWPLYKISRFVLIVEDSGERKLLLKADNMTDLLEQAEICKSLGMIPFVIDTNTGELMN